ncbi:MAG: aldo/keto reductase [Lachnospiraceae bacterium]|nr:aldo/keto reductase [Lachnospiraceae bacterium]
MKKIKLLDNLVVSPICYGPGIINFQPGLFNMRSSFQWRELTKYYKQKKTLKYFLKQKNTFIDTSSAYGYAENAIGELLKSYGKKEAIICTKLSAKDQIQNGKRIRNMFNNSLMSLGKIDIYLMHWPVPKNYIDVWKQMEELYFEKKVKCIGICNCNLHHLEELLKNCSVKPMIHQMEIHPLFTQRDITQFCKKEEIQIMAYTPLARNDDRLRNSKILKRIANRKNKTIAQIILRWHIQEGNIPVVNTNNIKHLSENYDIFNFCLSQEEMDMITGMNINSRLRYDADNCDFI